MSITDDLHDSATELRWRGRRADRGQGMNNVNDGGPAFPVSPETDREVSGQSWGSVGMSLRDYFAAKALPAVYAECVREMNIKGYPTPEWRYGVALDAYMMADAMLAARTAAKGE